MMDDMPPEAHQHPQFPTPSVLTWSWDPRTIPHATKILGVVHLLRDLRMIPMDFLLTTLSSDGEYRDLKNGFYQGNGLERLLNTVFQNKRGKYKLQKWIRPHAIHMVVKEVESEMDIVKKFLHMNMKDITPEFLTEFNLELNITKSLEEHSPWLRRILVAAAQTPRAAEENTYKIAGPFCTLVHAQIAAMRSQNSLRCAIPCGFFFYSCGASRKIINILSRCGLSPSYTALQHSHTVLATGQIRLAQLAARSVPFGCSWDNTQISLSIHVEQRTKAPPKVQTGTASIIYELRNTSRAHMKLQPILERRALCDIITYNAHVRPTVTPTRSQSRDITKHLIINIVEILTECQPGFEYLKGSSALQHRKYRAPPSGYKTTEHVLRTTTLDEGSTEGTVEVAEDIFLSQLKFNLHDLDNLAIGSWNDQKTNALIRSAQLLPRGDISAITRLEQLETAVGWFHGQLNLLWSIMRIHRGASTDLGSLQYYIALLGKTRLNSDQPEYETMRSFTGQVLSGNVLHYWEIMTGKSLESFAQSKPSAAELLSFGQTILEKFASEAAMLNPITASSSDDATFRNMILLNRDLLLFRELCSSVSSGDFGRVEILLGTILMMFSGAGCKNYTTELLYFIQNLRKVWTQEFADLIRDNSLVCMSGRDGHFIGVDKNCEQNINFQKDYWASKGVHASWEQLSHLSPNIPIYRVLKAQLSQCLGTPWQGVSHAKVDCSDQVFKVLKKAREYKLHLANFDGREKTTHCSIDVLALGKEVLQQKGIKVWAKGYKKWVQGVTTDPARNEENNEVE